MKKNTDLEKVLGDFENSAKLHGECTENGDYKTGNKSYKSLISSIDFLKDNNLLVKLIPFLNSPYLGVQLWASTFLLKVEEKLAVEKLEEIECASNAYSFTAEMTLKEWRKGNLKILD